MLAIFQTLRDRLDPRDWSRPWRDRPSYLPKMKECCCAPEAPCADKTTTCCGDLPCRLQANITVSGICSNSFDMELCAISDAFSDSSGRNWRGRASSGGQMYELNAECHAADNNWVFTLAQKGNCVGSTTAIDFSIALETSCAGDDYSPNSSIPSTVVSGAVAASGTYSCSPLSVVAVSNYTSASTAVPCCVCTGSTTLSPGQTCTLTITLTE